MTTDCDSLIGSIGQVCQGTLHPMLPRIAAAASAPQPLGGGPTAPGSRPPGDARQVVAGAVVEQVGPRKARQSTAVLTWSTSGHGAVPSWSRPVIGSGRKPRGLDTLPAKVRDGDVFVTLGLTTSSSPSAQGTTCTCVGGGATCWNPRGTVTSNTAVLVAVAGSHVNSVCSVRWPAAVDWMGK